LAESIIEKSPDLVADSIVCEGIKKGQESSLYSFGQKLLLEYFNAGVNTLPKLMCSKA